MLPETGPFSLYIPNPSRRNVCSHSSASAATVLRPFIPPFAIHRNVLARHSLCSLSASCSTSRRSDEEAIGPKTLMLHTPPLFPEITARARIPPLLLRADRNGRTFLLFLEWNDRADLFCHILWLILVHLDDGVRLAEERARAAGNENGADTGFLIEQAHPVRERSDGLVRFGDNSLHQLIPHHA